MLELLEIIIPSIGFAFGIYGGLKTKGAKMIGIIILSFILPFVCGFIWYKICNLLQWDDKSSGTNGLRALVWGITSIGPISIFAAALTFKIKIIKIIDAIKFLKSIHFFGSILIAIMAGIGSYIFYNTDFRGILMTNCSLTHEQLELYIILIWAFLIATFAAIALFSKFFNLRKSSILSVLMIPIISCVICSIGIKIYFLVIEIPQNDPKFIIRGIMAGFCLRFGLFYGLLFSMDKECYLSLVNEIKTRWCKIINKPIIP